jgi:hypothetical protein
MKLKSILIRFVKGFISGAISSMIVASVTVPSNWSDFSSAGTILIVSGLFGGINGLLLSIEKWLSWIEDLSAPLIK